MIDRRFCLLYHISLGLSYLRNILSLIFILTSPENFLLEFPREFVFILFSFLVNYLIAHASPILELLNHLISEAECAL